MAKETSQEEKLKALEEALLELTAQNEQMRKELDSQKVKVAVADNFTPVPVEVNNLKYLITLPKVKVLGETLTAEQLATDADLCKKLIEAKVSFITVA